MMKFSEFISLDEAARIQRIDRIRQGKLQKRVLVSNVQGYKVENGKLVKMSYQEIRHREMSQRKAARKRMAKMSQILRKRAISMKKRKAARLK